MYYWLWNTTVTSIALSRGKINQTDVLNNKIQQVFIIEDIYNVSFIKSNKAMIWVNEKISNGSPRSNCPISMRDTLPPPEDRQCASRVRESRISAHVADLLWLTPDSARKAAAHSVRRSYLTPPPELISPMSWDALMQESNTVQCRNNMVDFLFTYPHNRHPGAHLWGAGLWVVFVSSNHDHYFFSFFFSLFFFFFFFLGGGGVVFITTTVLKNLTMLLGQLTVTL